MLIHSTFRNEICKYSLSFCQMLSVKLCCFQRHIPVKLYNFLITVNRLKVEYMFFYKQPKLMLVVMLLTKLMILVLKLLKLLLSMETAFPKISSFAFQRVIMDLCTAYLLAAYRLPAYDQVNH